MKVITLGALKEHLRIDFEDDDGLLEIYAEAAEEQILTMTRRSYEELVAENERRSGEASFPRALFVAVLLYAANLYTYRIPGVQLAVNPVPYTLMSLVKPWVKLA